MNFLARSENFSPASTPSATPANNMDCNSVLLVADVDVWAGRVRASMRETFKGVLETGRILIRAKAALPYGQWLPMLAKAGLEKRQAQMWMEVARNPRFVNASPDLLLPPCMTTLHQIGKLPDDVYQGLRAEGVINPLVTRDDIKAVISGMKQKADEQRILGLAPVEGTFRTLVVDIAWASMKSGGGGRACPYALITQEECLQLPVTKWLMEDAHVYLWFLDGELENALALFRHWGVEFKQILTWNKTYPSGIPRMGLGYHFRNNAEHVLFGVRGQLRTREAARRIEKSFTAPVLGEHSTKPDKFYEIVRAASYPPFGEVFGRQPREGFVNLYEEAVKAPPKVPA